MPDDKTRLVYSTDRILDGDRIINGTKDRKIDRKMDRRTLGKKKSADITPSSGVNPSARQSAIKGVTVRLDRKARGGKTVTVIEGLLLPGHERDALLKELKTRLGTGGTVNDAAGLEIQGDHRDTLMSVLVQKGYKPKRSGG
jgi:translation initiation factor 1